MVGAGLTAVVLAGCSSSSGTTAQPSVPSSSPTADATPLDRLTAGCVQWVTASPAQQEATTRQNYEAVSSALSSGATPIALPTLSDDLLASVEQTTTQACNLGDNGTVYLIQFRIFGQQSMAVSPSAS